MNTVTLVGNLTKDIELRQSETTGVAKFNLAVRRDKENTDFINCVAFGKTAELLSNYTKKGDKIGVTGRIQTGSYEKEGQRIYTTEVIVREITFLTTKETKQEVKEEPAPDPYSNFLDDADID